MSDTNIIKLKATVSYGSSIQEAVVDIIPYTVKNAYFATKKEEIVYETLKGAEIEYKVVSGDNLSKIASQNGITVDQLKKENGLTSNTLKIGQKLKIIKGDTKKEKGKKVIFTPLMKASVGDEVYIVVETKDLEGKTIKVNVCQGKEKVIGEKDKELSITQNNKSITLIETVVGELAKDTTILNTKELENLAVVKVTLAPKEDKDIKDWNTKIKATTDKNTHLYLLIDAHTDNSDLKIIKYKGYKGEADDSKLTNLFLNEEGKWLEFKAEEYKVCPIDPKYRSHFVIHCTAGEMSDSSIKTKTKFNDPKKKKRSAAHIYVNKDGTKLEIWPLTEKNVWATKIESKKSLKGQMFHIELNYGSPDKPTEKQYQTLADLYEEASKIQKCWPIIVPHIEVDRGIADGHQDPTDFDYDHFYAILKKRGLPIDNITKFDHLRYWEKPSYKVPWSSDKTNWPPKLKGNPHK